MKLSIIVPCYNEELTISRYFLSTQEFILGFKDDCEFIFINDGSRDNTVKELTQLKENNPDFRIIILNFSRNFGKEAGILAGLRESSGAYVVTMDADLQDPPYLLPLMLEELEKGAYDSIATYRVDRKGEPAIRSFFARKFYQIINKISDVNIVDGARDYRMMSRTMVNSILELTEYHRFSKGIFAWVGYKTKFMEFENVERIAGETKWSFMSLFAYALEGLIAFTTVPLRISTFFGFVFSVIAFIYMIFVFIKALLFGDPVQGYPSMMVIILFLGGIQLLSLGILGEYLAKTYMEVKHRPNYIIKERL